MNLIQFPTVSLSLFWYFTWPMRNGPETYQPMNTYFRPAEAYTDLRTAFEIGALLCATCSREEINILRGYYEKRRFSPDRLLRLPRSVERIEDKLSLLFAATPLFGGEPTE